MKIRRREITYFLLILLFLYGFLLRIYRLGEQSFWIDEAFTINAANAILDRGYPLLESGFWYIGGILNSYITAISLFLFGFLGTSFAARLPSVIFGTLTIWLVYLFGTRLANKKVGLISAFLVAFSVWEIAWSRQARMYQQFQFFYILSLYLFYNYVETKEPKYVLLTLASTMLTILSHNLGASLVLIFILFALIALLFSRGENLFKNSYNAIAEFISKIKNNNLWLYVTIALSMACAIAITLFGYYSITNYNFVKKDYIDLYIYYLKNVHFILFYLAIPGLVVLFKDFKKGLLTFLGILVPLIMISEFVYLLHYRYLYFFLPLFFILTAAFIIWLVGSIKLFKRFSFVVIVLILLTFIHSDFIFIPRSHYNLEKLTPQQNFKDAYDYLKKNMQPGDMVIDAYPALNKIYLGKIDYAIKFSLSGREVDIANKTHDVYTGIPFIDLNALKKMKNCWLIIDKLAFFRIDGQFREYIRNSLLSIDYLNDSSYGVMLYKCF